MFAVRARYCRANKACEQLINDRRKIFTEN